MRTLQRFSELRLSQEELKNVRGGIGVTHSVNILGSNWSYSGELSMTADPGGVFSFNWTGQHSDFCGTVSIDGA